MARYDNQTGLVRSFAKGDDPPNRLVVPFGYTAEHTASPLSGQGSNTNARFVTVAIASGQQWLANLLVLFILVFDVYSAFANTNDHSINVEPSKRFRAFLEDPPWLTRVVFLRANSDYAYQPPSGRIVPFIGYSGYEGAIQPTGFYLKHSSNSFFFRTPTLPGYATIFGSSDRFWWHLSPGHDALSLAPRNASDGASPRNGREIVCKLQEQLLLSMRRCGMEGLENASLTWTSQDTFIGTTVNSNEVSGTIRQWTNGVPLRIEYRIGTTNIRHYRSDFSYQGTADWPPSRVVTCVSSVAGRDTWITNVILKWLTGLDTNATHGYNPTQFRVKSTPYIPLIVWSNGFRFRIMDDGLWSPIIEEDPQINVSGTISMAATSIVVGFAVVGAVAAAVARQRGRHLMPCDRSNNH